MPTLQEQLDRYETRLEQCRRAFMEDGRIDPAEQEQLDRLNARIRQLRESLEEEERSARPAESNEPEPAASAPEQAAPSERARPRRSPGGVRRRVLSFAFQPSERQFSESIESSLRSQLVTRDGGDFINQVMRNSARQITAAYRQVEAAGTQPGTEITLNVQIVENEHGSADHIELTPTGSTVVQGDEETITASSPSSASAADVAGGATPGEPDTVSQVFDAASVITEGGSTVGATIETGATVAGATATTETGVATAAAVETAGGVVTGVAIPLGAIASILGGLYGLGRISGDSRRVGVANGYTDAVRAFGQLSDPMTGTPGRGSMEPSLANSPEYQQGWQQGIQFMEGQRRSDERQYLSLIRGVRERPRREIFNAAYGHGIFREE